MSKNGLPWYQRFPRDLIEGTTGMPYDTKLQYWALIDLIYLYNNALPDDANFICGIFNCSKQLWRKVRADLISREKIQINSGVISNKVAEKVLISSEEFSEKQAKNRTGKSKNKGLQKPNDNQTETKSEPPQPHTQTEGIESLRSSIPKEEEEGAQARASLSVFEEVMRAVGVDPDKPPKFWRGAPAKTHVLGWQIVHGLTDDEVIEAARLSRGDNPDPPDGPKALDRYVATYAKAKASAGAIKPAASASPAPISKPLDRAGLVQFWADTINRGGFVSASSFSPSLAREILATGLVTAEQLKEKGIVA